MGSAFHLGVAQVSLVSGPSGVSVEIITIIALVSVIAEIHVTVRQ
jgi:hypothetical protein